MFFSETRCIGQVLLTWLQHGDAGSNSNVRISSGSLEVAFYPHAQYTFGQNADKYTECGNIPCGFVQFVRCCISGLAVKAQNAWRDVGQSHNAMHCSCHLL